MGLRIRQQEQANPGHPHHPPCHPVGTISVGEPPADCAQHTARQREASGQESSKPQIETVLGHVVLGHPERQPDVTTKYDRIVLAVLPDARIAQRAQLIGEGDCLAHTVCGIVIGKRPERQCGHQHCHGIHFRNCLPDPHARTMLGATNSVSATLSCLPKRPWRSPGSCGANERAVSDTHREGATGQSDEQACEQEVPVSAGVGDQVDGMRAARASARTARDVRQSRWPETERQANERTRFSTGVDASRPNCVS